MTPKDKPRTMTAGGVEYEICYCKCHKTYLQGLETNCGCCDYGDIIWGYGEE